MKNEMPMSDDILLSLGFKKEDPNLESYTEAWTHERAAGKFYWHVMTPDMVAKALIEIGHCEFRRKMKDVISSIEI